VYSLRVKLQELHAQKGQMEAEKAALEKNNAECVCPLPPHPCALSVSGLLFVSLRASKVC
jgi:hypothetical protein